jgi:hypothetical protein
MRESAHFEIYSHERLLASLLGKSHNLPAIREVLRKRLPHPAKLRLDSADLTISDIRDELLKAGVSFKSFVVGVLRDLHENRFRILLFIDNIDSKPSPVVELLLLRNSVAFFKAIREEIPVDVIICVRGSTFASLAFKSLDIIGTTMWESLQLRPPDLGAVLKRRVDCMRESGDWIGVGEWFLSDFLHRWITGMVSGKWPRDFLDIVEARHPYNVRGQLELFSSAATSTIFHHRRSRKLRSRDYAAWADVTPDFCLRALVWGGDEFYVESRQNFVPNVYDNGYPISPFNALLRPMVLAWASLRDTFTLEQLVETFQKAGVPAAEVESAFGAAERFSTIRQVYSEPIDHWRITSWGRYFLHKVYFRLAYVQTVWWDTEMLDGFTVGAPRLLEWDELAEPVRVFDHWLRLEEALVRDSLEVRLEDLVGESIWVNVSTEFVYALNSIVKSLPCS